MAAWCWKWTLKLKLEPGLNYLLKFHDVACPLGAGGAESHWTHPPCAGPTPTLGNHLPLGLWDQSDGTLTWEVKLWLPGMQELVNGAFWRCHTDSSQCLSLSLAGYLPANLQFIESLHRNWWKTKKDNMLQLILKKQKQKNILGLRVSTCILERKGFFANQHANACKMI